MKRSAAPGAEPFVPKSGSLNILRAASRECRGCDLYRYATQTVFGDGPNSARLFLIGEQPGDEEDRKGLPFVGPAGRILDRGLAEAGIDRADVYVTNAVKHFKFDERGKRRIHKRPSAAEVHACEPWLEAEVRAVSPELILCLGATAAQALMGSKFRLTVHRGKPLEHSWGFVVATVHPSAILRAPTEEQRHQEYRKFVADLSAVHSLLKASRPAELV